MRQKRSSLQKISTTESINLVASTFGRKFLNEGDEVVISAMEHHSNIVPWQMICEERGATLRVMPINQAGEIILEEAAKVINKKTKLVAFNQASNTLGSVNPIEGIGKTGESCWCQGIGRWGAGYLPPRCERKRHGC